MRVGDNVTIQTDTYPEVFHGRISYVAASLDPNTRTLQARIETSNPGEKLKKDMYVVATVNAGAIPNAIALPDAAVLLHDTLYQSPDSGYNVGPFQAIEEVAAVWPGRGCPGFARR